MTIHSSHLNILVDRLSSMYSKVVCPDSEVPGEVMTLAVSDSDLPSSPAQSASCLDNWDVSA